MLLRISDIPVQFLNNDFWDKAMQTPIIQRNLNNKYLAFIYNFIQVGICIAKFLKIISN